jgi:bifunctional non-homologous end joining protein LigD
MLALPTSVDLSDPKWDEYYVEPKFDGVRAIVEITYGNNVIIKSRTGHDLTWKCPALSAALKAEGFTPGTTIDGELGIIDRVISVKDKTGTVHWIPKIDFNRTAAQLGSLPDKAKKMDAEIPMHFMVFDVLDDGNGSTRHYSRKDRALLLSAVLGHSVGYMEPEDMFHLAPIFLPEERKMVYDRITAEGHEGIMLKRIDSEYIEGGRKANTWYKVKHTDSYDVIVIGSTEGKGKYTGVIGAIQFGAWTQDDEGVMKIVPVGQCSGFSDQERVEFSDNLPGIIEITCSGLVGSGEYPIF